jgi:oligopeptide/dipeptide ABC transporter ATP-binding protein
VEDLEVLDVLAGPAEQHRAAGDGTHGESCAAARVAVQLGSDQACQPDLLVADEPTSALDVTIQMQIIKLIREIQAKFQMTMILITHNLGLVAKMCDRVAVLYCGRIVEEAPVRELFKNPKHPYTRGLLASLPKGEKGDVELYTIPGQLPNPLYHPVGCSFSPRCPHVYNRCQEVPLMEQVSQDHLVRCWRWKEI